MVEIEEKIIHPFIRNVMTLRLLPIISADSNLRNKINLSEKQIMVLIMIDLAKNQALVSTIADELFLDRPQVSRFVDVLEDLGFVNRRFARRKQNKQTDRRKVNLEITDNGSEFLSQLYEDRHQFFSEILDSFDLKDIQKFNQFIEKFNALISKKVKLAISG